MYHVYYKRFSWLNCLITQSDFLCLLLKVREGASSDVEAEVISKGCSADCDFLLTVQWYFQLKTANKLNHYQ